MIPQKRKDALALGEPPQNVDELAWLIVRECEWAMQRLGNAAAFEAIDKARGVLTLGLLDG
jgi:hypothetical protein